MKARQRSSPTWRGSDPDAFLSLPSFIRESDLFLASIPVIEHRNVDTIGRRKSRGKSAELELVHLLEKYGYGARRSAASGVGGWVSDVEATKQGIWLAIEVKSSRRAYAIIPKHQMEKIRQHLGAFTNSRPKIISRSSSRSGAGRPRTGFLFRMSSSRAKILFRSSPQSPIFPRGWEGRSRTFPQ